MSELIVTIRIKVPSKHEANEHLATIERLLQHLLKEEVSATYVTVLNPETSH